MIRDVHIKISKRKIKVMPFNMNKNIILLYVNGKSLNPKLVNLYSNRKITERLANIYVK